MFFVIAAVRTPGLDPPPESAALFVVATTAGVVSYGLLDGEGTTGTTGTTGTAGYPAAMLTGGFALLLLALVATGTYGPAGPRTNPVGPVAYAALAVGVIVAAGAAWRNEAATATSSARSSVSE